MQVRGAAARSLVRVELVVHLLALLDANVELTAVTHRSDLTLRCAAFFDGVVGVPGCVGGGCAAVGAAVGAAIGVLVGGPVGAAVGAAVGALVGEPVGAAVGANDTPLMIAE